MDQVKLPGMPNIDPSSVVTTMTCSTEVCPKCGVRSNIRFECNRKRKFVSLSINPEILEKRLKTEDHPQPSNTNAENNVDTSNRDNFGQADDSCVVSSTTGNDHKVTECQSDSESSSSFCSSSSSSTSCSSSSDCSTSSGSSTTSSSSGSSTVSCSSSSTASDSSFSCCDCRY